MRYITDIHRISPLSQNPGDSVGEIVVTTETTLKIKAGYIGSSIIAIIALIEEPM